MNYGVSKVRGYSPLRPTELSHYRQQRKKVESSRGRVLSCLCVLISVFLVAMNLMGLISVFRRPFKETPPNCVSQKFQVHSVTFYPSHIRDPRVTAKWDITLSVESLKGLEDSNLYYEGLKLSIFYKDTKLSSVTLKPVAVVISEAEAVLIKASVFATERMDRRASYQFGMDLTRGVVNFNAIINGTVRVHQRSHWFEKRKQVYVQCKDVKVSFKYDKKVMKTKGAPKDCFVHLY